MRRRRSGAGASAANNAKLRIHSGDPSICTRLSRSTKRRRGTPAVSPVVAGGGGRGGRPPTPQEKPAAREGGQKPPPPPPHQQAQPVRDKHGQREEGEPGDNHP